MKIYKILYNIAAFVILTWAFIDGLSSSIDFLTLRISLILTAIVTFIYLILHRVQRKEFAEAGIKYTGPSTSVKLSTVGTIVGLWLPIILNSFGFNNDSSDQTSLCQDLNIDSEKFNILVIPFTNLSNSISNKNSTEAFYQNLYQNLPRNEFQISYCDKRKNKFISNEEITEIGKHNNVDMVVFGATEVYPSKKDSTHMTINFAMIPKDTLSAFGLQSSRMENLTDLYRVEGNANYSNIILWCRMNYLTVNARYSEANNFIDANLENFNKSDAFYTARGMVYLGINENEKGIKAFEKALEINPSNIFCRSALIKCYSFLNQDQKAVSTAQEKLSILSKSGSLTRFSYAKSLTLIGNHEEALKQLDTLILTDTLIYIYAYNTARIYLITGDYEKSLKYSDISMNLANDDEELSEASALSAANGYYLKQYKKMCSDIQHVNQQTIENYKGEPRIILSYIKDICQNY